jgi:uncharacterized membrane protein YiaA
MKGLGLLPTSMNTSSRTYFNQIIVLHIFPSSTAKPTGTITKEHIEDFLCREIFIVVGVVIILCTTTGIAAMLLWFHRLAILIVLLTLLLIAEDGKCFANR